MSFSICRIAKIKSSGVTGIQLHDRREKGVSHTNQDIDWSKTHENIDLLQQQDKFRTVVKNRIDELNLERSIRKDATVMTQCLITSDSAFFEKMNKDQQVEFFKKSYDFIKDRYGEENMVSATIHFDESTPHMHINFIPVTEDGRLSARDLFSPKQLRQLQDDFNKYVNDKGYDLERGKIDSKQKHLSVEEYKLETKFTELKNKENELDKQIKDLVIQRDAIRSDLKALESEKGDIERVRVAFEDINAVEVKYGALNKGLVNDVKGFEDIKLLAKKASLLESELAGKNRYIRDLEIDMKKLKKYMNESFDQNRNSENKVKDLEKKLGEYKKEYGYVVNFLKDIDQVDDAKKYVSEKREVENKNIKKLDIEIER